MQSATGCDAGRPRRIHTGEANMPMKRTFVSSLAALLLAVPSLLAAATYQIDAAHSTAGFTVRHMMVSNVSGAFTKLSGTVEYDPNNPGQTRVEAVIDAASIQTRNEKRDAHLRSPDFFDTANYPAITFRSRKVEKAGEGRLRVAGDLTIRGVTKEVVLDVDGPTAEIQAQGGYRMGASATARINRQDFGVKWNGVLDNGGVVVSDEVRIQIDVELLRKP
jgi:polyisoprenoid-binding protein YceI